MHAYDVVGIGNALMDILVEASDDLIRSCGLRRGEMRLVEEPEARALLQRVEAQGTVRQVVPGGSCANTVTAVARLGGRAAFAGAVGRDAYGDRYEQAMRADGVTTHLARREGLTGHALTLISSDGERTFAVCVGAAGAVGRSEIVEDVIAGGAVLHVEGYLLDHPAARTAVGRAMARARRAGGQVSLDVSDPGVVRRHRARLLDAIRRYRPLVFANDVEAEALTGQGPAEAAATLARHSPLVAVKCGARGSILQRGEEVVRIPARRARAVDTTGAGDAYAAAILYGFTHGWSLARCGAVASELGACIVEQFGARATFDVQRAVAAAWPRRSGRRGAGTPGGAGAANR